MKNIVGVIFIALLSCYYTNNKTISLNMTIPKVNSKIIDDFLIQPSFTVVYNKCYYILDTESYKIKIFDLDGKYLRSIGAKGSGPGEILKCYSFNVNKNNGDIYMVDDKNGRITIFSSSGKYKSYIGINNPTSSCLIIDNKVYALQGDGQYGFRVNIYKDGRIIDEIKNTDLHDKKHIKLLSRSMFYFNMHYYNGNIYVISCYTPFVYEINCNNKNIKRISLKNSLFADMYNQNLLFKTENNTIQIKAIYNGSVISEQGILVFQNSKKTISIFDINGNLKETINVNMQKDVNYLLQGVNDNKFIFRNFIEGIVEIYK